MQMEMDSHPSDPHAMDAALDKLRRDLLNTPPVAPEPAEDPDIIDYASVEFEVERMRKRLAVWEIFMAYMKDGARTLARGAGGTFGRGLRQDRGHLRRHPAARPPARPAVGTAHTTDPRPTSPRLTEQRRLLLATAKRTGAPVHEGAWPSSDGCAWRRPGALGASVRAAPMLSGRRSPPRRERDPKASDPCGRRGRGTSRWPAARGRRSRGRGRCAVRAPDGSPRPGSPTR